MPKQIILTFDVDMANYVKNNVQSHFDELDATFSQIKQCLIKIPSLKTTWFIRIDLQIEAMYGSALHVFEKHRGSIEWLRENGHVIGWHHHGYKKNSQGWIQNNNESENLEHIEKYGSMARNLGLSLSRLGWGYMTNSTMHLLDQLGFCIDSSAIPRPNYPWEKKSKDWEGTTNKPYFPSQEDYRIPGGVHPSYGILEVPITVANIPAKGDSVNMQRYINPAYDSKVFCDAMRKISHLNLAVLIMHPYEILLNNDDHPLFGNSGRLCLERNLQLSSEICLESITIDKILESNNASL